ncbi:MAG: iron transporter [Lachnospiraceae bacterium]|nr:iron transporter [Lachnospiraceae bacterium]
MKKKHILIIGILILTSIIFGGCSDKDSERESASVTGSAVYTELVTEVEENVLPDGIYMAEFNTDSSMFRVNEAHDGKGTLTVEDGKMTIHVSLGSQNIVNLYPGLSEDAKKENAILLEPTVDSVTYSDGWTDEVYGFDIPVPIIGEEFDVALIGKKGKWYDHKVVVSNPQPLDSADTSIVNVKETQIDLEDGSYAIDIIFEGGSGKAEILSPAFITVSGNAVIATLKWSSPYYDYMIVGDEKYLPVNKEGDSVFEIPVTVFDEAISVIGDTVAMSRPHEIEYSITFCSDTIEAVK